MPLCMCAVASWSSTGGGSRTLGSNIAAFCLVATAQRFRPGLYLTGSSAMTTDPAADRTTL